MTHWKRRPRAGFTWLELLVVIAIIGLFIALLLPARRSARGAARRSQCKNNLKQIGLAMHGYHEVYHAFPPAYTVDANGKPLHSWRTLILPWLEKSTRYDQLDLSKPWDDPANAGVFKTMPEAYRCPSRSDPKQDTTYLAIVGPGSCLSPHNSHSLQEITDGTSQTLIVVEVPEQAAVHWMSPQDADVKLLLNFPKETPQLHTGGFHGLLADGSVRFLSQNLRAETLQGLCTIAGQEVVGEF